MVFEGKSIILINENRCDVEQVKSNREWLGLDRVGA
jgi:hypothetical protein